MLLCAMYAWEVRTKPFLKLQKFSQLIIYLRVRVGRSVSLSLALEKLELFPCSPHLSIVVEDDGVIEVNERVIPGGGRLYDTVGPGSSGVVPV